MPVLKNVLKEIENEQVEQQQETNRYVQERLLDSKLKAQFVVVLLITTLQSVILFTTH